MSVVRCSRIAEVTYWRVSKLAGLFIIDPEFEKKLHSEARKIFHDWTADIQRQVQLDEVTDDDLVFLSNDEKIKLGTSVLKISECLKKCVGIKEGDKLYDVYFGDILWRRGVISELKRSLMFIRWDIEPLLRKIYLAKLVKTKEEMEKKVEENKRKLEEAREIERKRKEAEERQRAAKAEEERKKKEEEEWHAAYKALNVPQADAEKYLDAEEHRRFIKSIAGAVKAYLDRGKSYINDSRANDYLFYCDQIKQRKEKEQQKLTAVASARLFSHSVNEEINRLKARLHPQKQSPTKYFSKGNRYIGQGFYDLLSPDERKEIFDTVHVMVKKELDELVCGDVSDFIVWKHTQHYHLFPTGNYVLDDVPCLDFSLDTEAVVEAEIWLKPGQKTFGDYVFDLPVIEENNHSASLQEPKFLGYYYMHVAASRLPSTFWQRIPLLLIAGLTGGETEPPGVAILEASQSTVIYRIKNFKKEVIIPAIFSDFLKTAGGIGGMVSMGIVTQEVGSIVQRKLTEVEAAPMKQTSESARTGSYSYEEFISKMARLSYSKKDSEILLQHIPRGLSLDEALKWSLEHYREVIAGNHSTGNSQPPKASYTD